MTHDTTERERAAEKWLLGHRGATSIDVCCGFDPSGSHHAYTLRLTKLLEDYAASETASLREELQNRERKTYCHLCQQYFEGDALGTHGLGECVPLCQKCLTNATEIEEDFCKGCQLANAAEQELQKARERIAALERALRGLLNSDGHDPNCEFSGCTCRRVDGYKSARTEANRVLR